MLLGGEMLKYAKFTTVPIAVEACRVYVDGWYSICGKPKLCPAGTWLVKVEGKRGDRALQIVVPDDVFREGYRPTDSESEELWKERTDTLIQVWPDGVPIDLNKPN